LSKSYLVLQNIAKRYETNMIVWGTNRCIEIAFQIQNTSAKLLLVEPSLLSTALGAASKTNYPHSRIFLFSDNSNQTTQGVRDWHSIVSPYSSVGDWTWKQLNAPESAATTAVLNYSSGTTGMPKGVQITHRNIVSNIAQSIHMRNLEQPYDPSNRPQEHWLGFLPLYHAYGQLWSIGAALKTTSKCYLMRTFNYERFLSHLQRHRITHIQTAPPILVMLAKRPETSRYDLSSLKNILCGAAPLSKELQNEVSDKLNVKVVQTWGMTELTCSMLHVPGGRDDRSGSVGLIDPNSTLKLVDDEGKEVGVGERGEIYAKGPNVCFGYWRNTKATQEAFDEDGYLKTGDVAVRDEKGWYWIVDRKKELIKVKGFQVPPAELEAVLLEHEAVADAAVCAILM
jgi:4-coumarate--CoA ligase